MTHLWYIIEKADSTVQRFGPRYPSYGRFTIQVPVHVISSSGTHIWSKCHASIRSLLRWPQKPLQLNYGKQNLLAWSEKQAVVRDRSTSTWSQWRNNNQSGEFSVDSQWNCHFLNVTQPERRSGQVLQRKVNCLLIWNGTFSIGRCSLTSFSKQIFVSDRHHKSLLPQQSQSCSPPKFFDRTVYILYQQTKPHEVWQNG